LNNRTRKREYLAKQSISPPSTVLAHELLVIPFAFGD